MTYRDSRGRFVSASPKVRAGLEAMRIPASVHVEVLRLADKRRRAQWAAIDAIYRPERKTVLRRIAEWLMWHPR